MNYDEMRKILSSVLEKEDDKLDIPTEEDWKKLYKKFNCCFNKDFMNFINLMAEYSFPGDIYNVSSGKTNDNDLIDFVYDYEVKSGKWNKKMIPFYGIGNGDYLCISKEKSPNTPVYYFYAERQLSEEYCSSFEEWIKQLPTFLA